MRSINVQEKANKIKDTFNGNEDSIKIRVNKKSHKGWWIVTYIFLVLWITGFHYYGEDKRKSYEVFSWEKRPYWRLKN